MNRIECWAHWLWSDTVGGAAFGRPLHLVLRTTSIHEPLGHDRRAPPRTINFDRGRRSRVSLFTVAGTRKEAV
jgi:hypothetical protein